MIALFKFQVHICQRNVAQQEGGEEGKLFPCPSFPSQGSVKSQCLLRSMAVCKKKKKKKSGKDTLYQLKVPNTWSPCGRGDHLTPACVQSCARLFATL